MIRIAAGWKNAGPPVREHFFTFQHKKYGVPCQTATPQKMLRFEPATASAFPAACWSEAEIPGTGAAGSLQNRRHRTLMLHIIVCNYPTILYITGRGHGDKGLNQQGF